LMLANLIWLPAFDFEFFALFTVWFSHAFDFGFHWLAFGLLQILMAIASWIAYQSVGLPTISLGTQWIGPVVIVFLVMVIVPLLFHKKKKRKPM
jgi:hypothetical protein